jgi:hypothetical protein
MKRLVFLVTMLFGFTAIAQVAAIPGSEIPEWFAPLLGMIAGLPKIGPFLVAVMKYAGMIATLLTALSSILIGLQKVLEQLQKAKELAVVNKIIAGIKVMVPWVAYLSMLNVSRDAQKAAGMPNMLPNVTADGKSANTEAPKA